MEQQLTEEQIKLVNILENFYQKATLGNAPLLYTTGDLFSRLQSVYPSEEYTPGDVYQVMLYLGYDHLSSTANKITWLMQDKP
jgi:hypothetical protein